MRFYSAAHKLSVGENRGRAAIKNVREIKVTFESSTYGILPGKRGIEQHTLEDNN